MSNASSENLYTHKQPHTNTWFGYDMSKYYEQYVLITKQNEEQQQQQQQQQPQNDMI